MLNPVGRAGVAQFTPLMRANDTAQALENWRSLDQALESAGRSNGTVILPAGPLYVENASKPALTLNVNRSFVTVQGAGRDKTILIPLGTSARIPLAFTSSLVGYEKDGSFSSGTIFITSSQTPASQFYEIGEVIYFWKRVLVPTDTRSPRQRVTVTDVDDPATITVSASIGIGLPGTPDDFKHIKGFAVSGTPAAGDTTVTLATTSLHSRFNFGDDILIGDGPGINEFYGEWVKVTEIDSSTGVITFEPPLQQSYGTNLGCIVPGRLNPLTGRRQHMTDIVFRDLSIAAPTSGEFAGVFGVVRGGTRIRFENVGFVASPFAEELQAFHEIAFATCGDVTIRDGFYEGKLLVGPCQNVTVDNVVAGSLKVGEFSRACNLLNVTTMHEPGIEVNGGLCTGVTLTNCAVRGEDAIALVFAEKTRIANMTAVELVLLSGSSGVLTTPLAPDPNGVVDGTSAGDWLEPLQRQVKDRKVRSKATTHPTLELAAITSQTADLQQWQNASGGVLVSVSKDGVFKILGSASETLTIQPGSSPVNGIDMLMSSGGDLRLGSPYGTGALLTLYSNGANQGQAYLECGDDEYAAIIMRTGLGGTPVTRFSLQHNGPLLLFTPSDTGSA